MNDKSTTITLSSTEFYKTEFYRLAKERGLNPSKFLRVLVNELLEAEKINSKQV